MDGTVTLPWAVIMGAGSAYVSLVLFVRFLYERERREDKEELRELKDLLGRSVAADTLPREARRAAR